MRTTFKLFLIEGGNATKEWGTKRVTRKDIDDVLKILSAALSIDKKELEDNLLGTTRLTYANLRKNSGDIDIAVSRSKKSKFLPIIKQISNQQVVDNTGTKVCSFVVTTSSSKPVQVDMMFTENPNFAHFIYHSSEGENSKYPGATRNIMLMTLATFILEIGKDFVVKNEKNEIIARASRSLKLDVGLERLFKVAKRRKDGQGRVKSLEKVSPDELESELKDIDSSRIGKFTKSPEIINDPDKIAEFLFGAGVKSSSIMTAEDVAAMIKKKFKGQKLKKIISAIKEQLTDNELEIPSEL